MVSKNCPAFSCRAAEPWPFAMAADPRYPWRIQEHLLRINKLQQRVLDNKTKIGELQANVEADESELASKLQIYSDYKAMADMLEREDQADAERKRKRNSSSPEPTTNNNTPANTPPAPNLLPLPPLPPPRFRTTLQLAEPSSPTSRSTHSVSLAPASIVRARVRAAKRAYPLRPEDLPDNKAEGLGGLLKDVVADYITSWALHPVHKGEGAALSAQYPPVAPKAGLFLGVSDEAFFKEVFLDLSAPLSKRSDESRTAYKRWARLYGSLKFLRRAVRDGWAPDGEGKLRMRYHRKVPCGPSNILLMTEELERVFEIIKDKAKADPVFGLMFDPPINLSSSGQHS